MFLTIIAFVIVLLILVLIHELGHFLVAKKLGVKVEEFGFGFPPRIFGIKRGETLYSLNLLPVGGFVKLYGEDEAGGGSMKVENSKLRIEGSQLKRAYFARPAWQRALIVVAGVIMNFALAVGLISYLFASQGVAVPTDGITVSEVVANSPAQASGIQKGDRIKSIDGRPIADLKEFISYTKTKTGESIDLELKRNDQILNVQLIPRKESPKGEGPIGIAITSVEIKKYSWYEAPFYGTWEALKYSWMIVTGLGGILVQLATTGATPEGVAGPVGVAQLTGQAVEYGPGAVMWLIALLSLNLAVLNILPIPALDGGRLFFILIEMVVGRRVSHKYESYAHAIGLAVLLGLMVLITVSDVSRLLAGESLIPTP